MKVWFFFFLLKLDFALSVFVFNVVSLCCSLMQRKVILCAIFYFHFFQGVEL